MYPEYPQNEPTDFMAIVMANKVKVGLIIGGGLIFLTILSVVAGMLLTGGTPVEQKLAATGANLTTLGEFTGEQEDTLISQAIRDRNADLGVALLTAAHDINGVTLNVYGIEEAPEELVAVGANRFANMQVELQTATANNTYDSTYQKQMSAEVRTIMNELAGYTEETPPEVTEVIVKDINDLSETLKRFEELDL